MATVAKPVVLISNGFQSDYEAGFANGLAANGIRPILISSDRTLVNRLRPEVRAKSLRGSQEEGRSGFSKALQFARYIASLTLYLLCHRPTTHMIGLFAASHIRSKWADKSWLLECRLWKVLSRRLVMTVHNVLPHGRDTVALRTSLRKIYRIPDKLVVHTQRMKDRLVEEFDVPVEKIVVMEHGIDRLADGGAAAKTEAIGRDFATRSRSVLCFGTIQRYKGVDLLIEAARKMSADIQVSIAGRCTDGKYRLELEQLIADRSGGAGVSWLNSWLSEEQIEKFLEDADVLVLPYRHIDQSGVLFAALRHGLPVVAFDVGSFRDYLELGLGTVVECGNVDALANAISSIDCSEPRRRQIRELAKRFLWSETVRPVLAIYAE